MYKLSSAPRTCTSSICIYISAHIYLKLCFYFRNLGFNEKTTRSPYVRAGRAGSVSTLIPGTDTETGVSTHSSTIRSLSKPEVLKSATATGTGKGASTYSNSGSADKDASNAHTPVRSIAIISHILFCCFLFVSLWR